MLTARARERLREWRIAELAQVDDHPFAWWAMLDGEYVVVKAGDPVERAREAAALNSFRSGATRVVAHDHDLGLLVTYRVLPGDDIRPLARQDDDAATREIASLAVSLHRDQGDVSALPPLRDIGAAFEASPDSRLPRRIVDAAQRTLSELTSDDVPAVGLHGDLQHLNVVNSGDGWLAIDPHGWIGDPTFEAAALLANPRGLVEGGDARGMDGRALASRSRHRAELYAEVTGYDIARIRAWGFVGCIIAELRMIKSHNLLHGAPLAVAEALLAEGG
jgi:streptomycin 6-kinase